jgi:hypothetical protein
VERRDEGYPEITPISRFPPSALSFAVRHGVAARCEGRTVRVVGFVKKKRQRLQRITKVKQEAMTNVIVLRGGKSLASWLEMLFVVEQQDTFLYR